MEPLKMNDGFWAKIPTAWIRYDKGLVRFKASSPGVDAAALKLYIVLCLLMARTARDPSKAGVLAPTYDQLEAMSDLSRALVSRGLRRLEEYGTIVTARTGRSNRYLIAAYDDQTRGWGKLPETYLLAAEYGTRSRLNAIGHRARADRDALKIYLALVSFRDGGSGASRLSYDKIEDYTGVPRRGIRRAMSVLFEAGLVSRERLLDTDGEPTAAFEYFVSGMPERRGRGPFSSKKPLVRTSSRARQPGGSAA